MPKLDPKPLEDMLVTANSIMDELASSIRFEKSEHPAADDWAVELLDADNDHHAIDRVPANMVQALISSGHLGFYVANLRKRVQAGEDVGIRIGRSRLQDDLRRLLDISS